MPLDWLLRLAQQDASGAGLTAFVWLSAIAIGLGWYASRMNPHEPRELELLHREIDDLRDRIRCEQTTGARRDDLVARLEDLCRRLPAADARRRR